jgi:hypothetical protein
MFSSFHFILCFLPFAVKTGVLFLTYANSIVKTRKEIANNKHPQAAQTTLEIQENYLRY